MAPKHRRSQRRPRDRDPLILAPHLPPATAEELREALLELLIATQASTEFDETAFARMESAVHLLQRGASAECWDDWSRRLDPDREWLES